MNFGCTVKVTVAKSASPSSRVPVGCPLSQSKVFSGSGKKPSGRIRPRFWFPEWLTRVFDTQFLPLKMSVAGFAGNFWLLIKTPERSDRAFLLPQSGVGRSDKGFRLPKNAPGRFDTHFCLPEKALEGFDRDFLALKNAPEHSGTDFWLTKTATGRCQNIHFKQFSDRYAGRRGRTKKFPATSGAANKHD